MTSPGDSACYTPSPSQGSKKEQAVGYWLMKSEPSDYSIDDLERDGMEPWDGIRNYQARNLIRDEMQVGDLAFFYHSSCKVPAIVGIMKIVSEAYPDPTQFDPKSNHYDAKSNEDDPRWLLVDVAFERKTSGRNMAERRREASGAGRSRCRNSRNSRGSTAFG